MFWFIVGKRSSFIAFFCVVLLIPSSKVEAKICGSIDVRNYVSNLNKLRNCTEIIGDLTIVLMENTESESDYDPYVFPELQKVTGFVMLFNLRHFTSLGKLFPNLRLIRGLTLLHIYSLVIYNVPKMKEEQSQGIQSPSYDVSLTSPSTSVASTVTLFQSDSETSVHNTENVQDTVISLPSTDYLSFDLQELLQGHPSF